jgi:hypothetical protein
MSRKVADSSGSNQKFISTKRCGIVALSKFERNLKSG